jgi:hypothetical protein
MLNKLAVQKVGLLLFTLPKTLKLSFDRQNQCITKILRFMQEKWIGSYYIDAMNCVK